MSSGSKVNVNPNIVRLVQAALLAAIAYICFVYLKIVIPMGPGKLTIHFGNCFVTLAALLLGGVYGGLAGAVGLTLADLLGGYVDSALPTFVLKLGIGFVTALVAHTIFRMCDNKSSRQIWGISAAASAAGLIFNVIADPLVRFFYKAYFLKLDLTLADALMKIDILGTAINAVVSLILSVLLYNALLPTLKKGGLYVPAGRF